MPGRPLQFGLRRSKESICRVCLLVTSKSYPQTRTATYSTAATRRSAAPRIISRKQSAFRPSAENKNLGAGSEDDLAIKNLINSIQSETSSSRVNEQSDAEVADMEVNYFEQVGNTRQRLPDEEAFQNSMNTTGANDYRRALEEMKNSIQGDDDKKAFGQVMDQLDQVFERAQGVPDIKLLTQKLDEYTKSIDQKMHDTISKLPKQIRDSINFDVPELSTEYPLPIESTKDSSPQVLEGPWTLAQRRKIVRLNDAIDRVYCAMQKKVGPAKKKTKLAEKDIFAIYKAYHAARLSLAYSWSHVPIEVWDFLWKVFSVDESINMHRLAHISMLAKDMDAAKVDFKPQQQLLAIEAMFTQGWEEKAVANWKRCIGTLGKDTAKTYKGFWELGVLMHCRTGDLEQAQRAVDKLISQRMDPRILLPLINFFSEQATAESQEKAWKAYRQMRDLLGKTMTLNDYDTVVAYFLATGQTESALYAFVDMMSDGKIDMTKQKYMPSVVANKFFFGKWLKRLIGAGNLDGALSVVEFMQAKGIEAAPVQINGLIGALQRSGGALDLERSEKIGWEMVENRIEFVRQQKASLAAGVKLTERFFMVDRMAPNPAPLPRATLETFCILAENYRLRDLQDRVKTLWEAFEKADISPDAFMMNQLIESHVQDGDYAKAVELHRHLVSARGVKSDPYTFSVLWKTLAVSRVHVVTPDMSAAATAAARDMFAQTVACRDVFDRDEQQRARMDGQLARKMLHTFRRLEDTPGMLTALRALRDVFGFLPTDLLVLELVLGTTRLAWDTPAQRRRLLHARREIDCDVASRSGASAGDDDDGDDTKPEGANRGVALYEYLVRRYMARLEGGEGARRALVTASKEMGVHELMKGAGG